VKIRTRAFTVLWLMTILGVGAIVFILISINVIAPSMDAERQRIAEVLDLHSSLWRALVELKHDQHDQIVLALPSIREQLQRQRSAVNDYLAHEASLLRDAEQKDRLTRLTQQYEKWVAQWEAADPSGSPEYVLAISEKEFAPVEALLREFDKRERELGADAVTFMARRRQLFFAIVAAIAGVGALTLVAVMLSTKKVILDPLTELTDSAHRIEMGDFNAAHQTLRADEIGLLINSFAKMVQAVPAP
jgi:nitrate/nitrite-specific signal transduction histidine kinase